MYSSPSMGTRGRFFTGKKSPVANMLLSGWNMDEALSVSKEEGYEDGYDDGKAEVIKYKNLEIYLRTTDDKKHYVWYDENYAFKLVCFESLSQAEILKIIDGME